MQDFDSGEFDRPDRATAWVDLASPSHPFFFAALTRNIDATYCITARQKTETVDLARTCGFDPTIVGRDFDNSHLRKIGIPIRTAQLALSAPAADISLSARNAMCILASKTRRIPSIHFTDNDITAHVDGLHLEKLYNRFEATATHSVVPRAFEVSELTRWGLAPERIHTYDGYKEDVYVADFDPDPRFPETLPIGEYVVVRPEALSAAYVETTRSIVPELLDGFVDCGYDVVYLPRGRGDQSHADAYPPERVYVPSNPVDGLQLAWHARCVLTGSGTMAREAACMEKPAVSFFPNTPLSVDAELIDAGRIVHSRDPATILEYVTSLDHAAMNGDRQRSTTVRDELVALVSNLVRRESSEESP